MYTTSGRIDSLPVDSVPVDVLDAPEGWRVSFYQALEIMKEKPTTNVTFMDHLFSQPEHISQYYTQVDFHTVPSRIYEYLKSTKKVLIAIDC